jgi:CheY-like chemotaxis protein
MLASPVKRLLVMTDQTEVADLVCRVGEAEGFKVYVAANGVTFKIAYNAFAPDAILLDMTMAGRNGVELLKYLAAEGCSARIISLNSGAALPGSLGEGFEAARRLEIAGSLETPIRAAELRRHLLALKKPG